MAGRFLISWPLVLRKPVACSGLILPPNPIGVASFWSQQVSNRFLLASSLILDFVVSFPSFSVPPKSIYFCLQARQCGPSTTTLHSDTNPRPRSFGRWACLHQDTGPIKTLASMNQTSAPRVISMGSGSSHRLLTGTEQLSKSFRYPPQRQIHYCCSSVQPQPRNRHRKEGILAQQTHQDLKPRRDNSRMRTCWSRRAH